MPSVRTKILIVVLGLDIGGAHGGAERCGIELSRNLPRQQFEATLCAFWRHGTATEAHWLRVLKDDGIPMFFASNWSGRYHAPSYARGLIRVTSHARRRYFDIVHSHCQIGTLSACILKTLKFTRIVIRTAHTPVEWGTDYGAWLGRQIFMEWLYPIWVDAEVGDAQVIVDQLKRHRGSRLLNKKIPTLIHTFVDTSPLSANGDARATCRQNSAHVQAVGSIGRLSEEKGHKYLLSAIPYVVDKLPNARFVIIGDGPLRPELQRRATELGISHFVTFAGQQSDVAPFLSAMDLFVLPSVWEGLPISVLESMAHGVAVIASDLPGTREVIEHGVTGWLVPPADPVALAHAIIHALRSPRVRTEVTRRAAESLKPFSRQQVVEQHVQLYSSILARAQT